MFHLKHKNILNFLQKIQEIVAKLIVPIILKTNITPNQVTIGRLIIGAIPIVYFFSYSSYYYNIIGLIYAIFIITLDVVDGELARQKNMTSRLGQYLDESSDRIIMYVILGSVFIFNNEFCIM